MNILGVDVGNATTVTNTGVIIDSKTSKIKPITSCNKLEMDNEVVYVGEGEYDTTYRKLEKDTYLQLLYTAIALSTKSRTVSNQIVLGLPLSQYNEDREALIQKVLSNNDKWININDTERHIIIDDVEVFPEGVFTVDDEYQGIVIDIGGRTTDCALIEVVRGKKKILDPISIPTGTINLYDKFIDSLNMELGLDLKLRDAERILESGLILDGTKVNIDFAKRFIEEYSENLYRQLQLKYSLKTNIVTLTGGGADLVYNHLESKLGQGLIKQRDSIKANAKNFYEVGVSIFE